MFLPCSPRRGSGRKPSKHPTCFVVVQGFSRLRACGSGASRVQGSESLGVKLRGQLVQGSRVMGIGVEGSRLRLIGFDFYLRLLDWLHWHQLPRRIFERQPASTRVWVTPASVAASLVQRLSFDVHFAIRRNPRLLVTSISSWLRTRGTHNVCHALRGFLSTNCLGGPLAELNWWNSETLFGLADLLVFLIVFHGSSWYVHGMSW